MAFKVTVDTKGFDKVIDRLASGIDKAALDALMEMGDELLRVSTFEVPHDEGVLQSSGNVEPEGDAVIVGYHTPYAARLHEHPEYRFQKGRKGKYLEDPLKLNLSKWEKLFAAKMEAFI